MNRELLKKLPGVDELSRAAVIYANKTGEKDFGEKSLSLFVRFSKEIIGRTRERILGGEEPEISCDYLSELVFREVSSYLSYSLKPVINGTGITLHTNFGRAVMGEEAVKHVTEIMTSYSNLEYDVEGGVRGSRYSHVERLLCDLTGCESAVIVNNNAAAVMLILHALGYKKNMIISRGELVEIGGSFRIPAIMEISGVTLKEVGCTNRTHLSDYENAIDGNTGAILKVHTSNFVIRGYTESVDEEKLSELSHKYHIPLIYDMGASLPGDDFSFADVYSFSGDKLLGGPQAGIIAGKKEYIDIIKKDNLIRTLRVDKMTVAAMEATLMSYIKGEEDILPTHKMLDAKKPELIAKYDKLITFIGDAGNVSFSPYETFSETGGGSKPGEEVYDLCLEIGKEGLSADDISQKFRKRDIPIVGRISDDRFLLSVRTIFEKDFPEIKKAVLEL